MTTTCLFGIEVIRPTNLDVCEEVLVSLCSYRRSDPKVTLRADSTSPFYLHIAMGRNGSYGQKEWLVSRDRLIKKTFRVMSQYIGVVLPLMADRWVSVPLPSTVEIFVRVRVQEEIRVSKSRRIR